MLCQLLSLDKRYHTVNCFSFNKIDSYLNFNNIPNLYSSNHVLTNNVLNKQKINYKNFNINNDVNSSFLLTHKYNLYNKNYTNSYEFFKLKINNIFLYFTNFFNFSLNINVIKNINIREFFLTYNLCFVYYYINIFNQYCIYTHLFNYFGIIDFINLYKTKVNNVYFPNNFLYYKKFNPINILYYKKFINYSSSNHVNNNKNIQQYFYDTQFILKNRHPLHINTKFININPTSVIFNMQILQNPYNMYFKHYINLMLSEHIFYLFNNKNILLFSDYTSNIIDSIKYDVLINTYNTYVYKYNTKLYNHIYINIFDKNTLHNTNILHYPN